MKKFIEIKETVTRRKLTGIVCDWCGEYYKSESDFNNERSYKVDQFELTWRVGDNYPEFQSGRILYIEICHKCREKFFQKLKELKIEVQERKYDY